MNSPNPSEPERIEPKPRLVPANCEKHGAYKARELASMFGSPPIVLGCPACQQEMEARRKAEEAEKAARLERERIDAMFRRSRIPPRFADRTLASYRAENDGQRHALKIAQRFVENFDPARGTSLVFCGKPGTGKTHIACGVAHALVERKHSALFASVLSAVRHVKETYRRDSEHSESDAIEDFISPKLLILDEVGVQVGSEHEKMLLFEIINERYQRCRSTILISNLTADELCAYLGDRVIDRFREDGAVVAFDWDSYRTRRVS